MQAGLGAAAQSPPGTPGDQAALEACGEMLQGGR